MSNTITAGRFQIATEAPSDAALDTAVGTGVDVVGAPGCSTAHVEPNKEKGFYDVKINGDLIPHLNKKQLEGLHFDQCTAPASSSAAPPLASTVERHPTKGHKDRETTEIKDFKAPGWRRGDTEACFEHANAGAEKTCSKGDTPTGGGGVILYEKGDPKQRRMSFDKNASAVAVDQIKRHIDAGKAVVAGANLPGISKVIDKVRQPVTDHFVAIYGYETDDKGKVIGLLAKDNATNPPTDIRFEVRDDGSIVKPNGGKTGSVADMEYQLSEVRFHTSMPYEGKLRPTNDAGSGMVWWPKA
jgi:hypothetical protein